MPEDDPRVSTRAEKLSPEEKVAGSDDPVEQARVILEDSDRRSNDRNAAPGKFVEHRTSEEATPPVD
jgi:hypothetical protein